MKQIKRRRNFFERVGRKLFAAIKKDERIETHNMIKVITDKDLKKYSLVKNKKTSKERIGYMELVLSISGKHLQAHGFNYEEAAKKIEEVRGREEALKNWGKNIARDEYHQKLLNELHEIFGDKKYLHTFEEEIPLANRALKIRYKQFIRSAP